MGREVTFNEIVASLPQRGMEWHRETLLENSRRNASHVIYTIRDLPAKNAPALVVSAGPSLYRQKTLSRLKAAGFSGTVVATDGAYIQCLKAGITPDFVITLDPHPTRIVRWFGDPEIRENSYDDPYFSRQDLDVSFRNVTIAANEENIRAVDKAAVPIVICTASPANVVSRTSRFHRFWFAPLVDSTAGAGSITRAICEATGCPALNTGGTVGTAAWNFAHSTLGSRHIAVVGMDLGYYTDLPLEQTQEWDMLKGDDLDALFPIKKGFWGESRASVTYWFYRENFLSLLSANKATVTNCSEHGLLYGDGVNCMNLEQWLSSSQSSIS